MNNSNTRNAQDNEVTDAEITSSHVKMVEGCELTNIPNFTTIIKLLMCSRFSNVFRPACRSAYHHADELEERFYADKLIVHDVNGNLYIEQKDVALFRSLLTTVHNSLAAEILAYNNNTLNKKKAEKTKWRIGMYHKAENSFILLFGETPLKTNGMP